MRFELKDYQEQAARKVISALHRGIRDYASVQDRDFTAISLSAPTGAGKTVIAAAVIERVFFGAPDTGHPADPNAIFLWLTDDPNLNAQTRKRMIEASDRIQPSQLVKISPQFDELQFDARKVYFLNVQKLARTTNYVRRREGIRKHSIWETINNTITNPNKHLCLVIDEAHRGTGRRSRESQTNAQRLINGSQALIRPTPVVLGITATPDRFETEINASMPARVLRKVHVPIREVRESGLLKDTLSIQHRAEDQAVETTLVRQAVRNIKEMDTLWQEYTKRESEPRVRPLLVVQVPPETQYSHDAIGDLISVCQSEWGELSKPGAIRHAFGQHAALKFGPYGVSYIAPEDIQDDPRIRLVLFKEALTTGWDCPRAETMLSLRKADDDTYIAQLIGRMVRTPLARRIESDDRLNRVRLYLPEFNLDAVKAVKASLEADAEGPALEVEINTVDVPRNASLPDDVFDALAALPTYIVPGPIFRSQVGRLNKLAALLVGSSLLADAISVAGSFLNEILQLERARLEADGALAHHIKQVRTASASNYDINLCDGTVTVSEEELPLHPVDLDTAFKATTRIFRDGLADSYWGYLVVEQNMNVYDAKVLVAAMAREASAAANVEAAAETRINQWLSTYGQAITSLSEDKKAKFADVRAMARSPEVELPALKELRAMPSDGPQHRGHLYANAAGFFVAKLGSWESDVLAIEQSMPNFVGWYRNPPGGRSAIRIPFRCGIGDELAKMYPDFVFFHRNPKGEVRASIVDPHGHHLSDAGPKLRGLAAYAKEHGDSYDRIVSVIRLESGAYRSIDLKQPTVGAALAGVNSKADIEALFNTIGFPYS